MLGFRTPEQAIPWPRATRPSPADAGRPCRPPFDDAIRYWRRHLDILRPGEPLRWVFRENVRLGGGGADRRTATVAIRPDDPAFDPTDARAVYDRATRSGCEDLCFELLYAAPEQVFATLRRGRAPEPFALAPDAWDVTFQLAPSFHVVEEIDDPALWRSIARGAPRSTPLLRGVLAGGEAPC